MAKIQFERSGNEFISQILGTKEDIIKYFLSIPGFHQSKESLETLEMKSLVKLTNQVIFTSQGYDYDKCVIITLVGIRRSTLHFFVYGDGMPELYTNNYAEARQHLVDHNHALPKVADQLIMNVMSSY